MKKIIFVLSSLLALSCAKNNLQNENTDQEGNDSQIFIPIKKNPSPKPQPQPEPIKPIPNPDPTPEPKPISNIVNLKFGKDGIVTLNNETGEYNINKIPKNNYDISLLLPFSYIYDSLVSDSIYIYKSSLFPIDRYSLLQIPNIIYFNKEISVESQPSNDKYDVALQIGGNSGKKRNLAYFICYKSVDNKFAKFDFMVEENDKLLSNPSCEKYKKLIDEKKVTPLDYKGGDYLMLNISQFRAYAHGECFDNAICKIWFNADINYYISSK